MFNAFSSFYPHLRAVYKLSFPSPGDLSDPGIETGSPAPDSLPSEPPGKPHKLTSEMQFRGI